MLEGLVELASHLDDASTSVDVEHVLAGDRTERVTSQARRWGRMPRGRFGGPGRRRLPVYGLGVAVAAAVALVVGVVAAWPDTGEPTDVQMGTNAVRAPEGEPPTGFAADDQVVLTEGYGLAATPAIGLRGGEEIALALVPEVVGAPVRTLQCAAEVVAYVDQPDPGPGTGFIHDWCGGDEFELGGFQLALRVRRLVQTRDGAVDCAAAPGRCVVMVRVDGPEGIDDRFAPLAFDPSLGPLPEARLELVGGSGPFQDGQLVEVRGSGFVLDVEVELRQCIAPPVLPDGSVRGTCDQGRAPVLATPDGAGDFVARFIVYREISSVHRPVATPEWAPCDPCFVAAGGTTVPLTIAPTATPIHPSIRIEPSGPHRPGQQVRVVGVGFQRDPHGLETGVAYCPADALQAERCGGGPELGDLGVGEDGSFVIEDFELPSSPADLQEVDCTERPGACVLAWYAPANGALRAGVPLDLSG